MTVRTALRPSALAVYALLLAAPAYGAPITVSGIWTSIDSCSPCTGIGTSTLEDGIPGVGSFTNLFAFEGASLDVDLGEIFVLGTFTFRNGRVGGLPGGSPPTFFDLALTTTSPEPAFNQSLTLRFHYTGTPAVTGNREASADYIRIEALGSATQFNQAFRVYEDNADGIPSVARIELLGRINSLHYEGFGNLLTPTSGFVTATAARDDLTPIAAVPEPATVILVGTGLLAAGTARRRRKNPRRA